MRLKEVYTSRFAPISTVLALAWPTMLEQFMQTAVQYVDTAMVGSLGTAATAAVGATATVNWLFGSTISAVAVGFLAFVAQSRGAGRFDTAKKASSQAALAVIVLGVIFTIIPLLLSGLVPRWMQVAENIRPVASTYFFIIYTPMLFRVATIIFGTLLRSVGDAKTPMLVGIVVNVVNVSLNAILIYEPFSVTLFGAEITLPFAGLGVLGAAIATAVSYAVGGILISVAVWRHSEVTPKGQSLRPDKEILLPCLRVAIPNALQRFGTSLGYVAFASMVNSLGEVATAAHTIANTVESAFYIPGYGMQTATATLAGNAYGARDEVGIRRLSRTVILLEAMMMMVSGGLLFCFAPHMMDIFSDDGEVIALGATVLRMVAVSEPLYGISIVVEGMMQGMGKTTFPFVSNIIGMWLVRIVGTFICINFFSLGLISAWACMILHNVMLFVLFIAYFISGRWRPQKHRLEII